MHVSLNVMGCSPACSALSSFLAACAYTNMSSMLHAQLLQPPALHASGKQHWRTNCNQCGLPALHACCTTLLYFCRRAMAKIHSNQEGAPCGPMRRGSPYSPDVQSPMHSTRKPCLYALIHICTCNASLLYACCMMHVHRVARGLQKHTRGAQLLAASIRPLSSHTAGRSPIP